MDERGIIIADRDAEFRNEMAEYFTKAGYRVETSDSAVHVLCQILEKQAPVLLLGSDFDKKVSCVDLIHLLKKCNRRLHVIIVSDQLPLEQARRIRREGIFYHALKPAAPGDAEEIGMAVACAFRKHCKGDGAVAEPDPGQPELCRGSCQVGLKELKKDRIKELLCLLVIFLIVAGTCAFSVIAAHGVTMGNDASVWLFLTFSATVVATQSLPIFRIRLPGRIAASQAAKKEQDASLEGR